MGLVISIALIAAGAVLLWFVETSVVGVDSTTLGLALLLIGFIGAFLSVALWDTFESSRRRSIRLR